jgi:hypothetical protein
MSNIDIALYIHEKVGSVVTQKRLTLFPDEKIRLKRSIQSLQDLTKVFTDFTQSFSAPADDNNNSIFKHYYDAQIVNGFDARVKIDARIELGGVTYKVGKIQLNGASLKSNVPVKYDLEFFGDTIKIKDLIGDKKLTDLDLSAYDHNYDAATIKTGLTNSLFSGVIKYGLISYKRRFLFQDAQLDNDTNINIKYDSTFTSGVDFKELKPCIKADAILQAIKTEYSLDFTNDFFGRSEWQSLYMSLGNGESNTNPFSGVQVESFTVNVFQRSGSRGSFRGKMRASVTVNSGTQPYRMVFLVDGIRQSETAFTTNTTQSFSYDFGLVAFNQFVFSYEIESSGALNASVTCSYDSELYLPPFGVAQLFDSTSTTNTSVLAAPQVEIKKQISDIKVVDWFAAIVKAFNLTIEPLDDGSLLVNDLPSWYNTGNIIDVSEYVDIETLDVERGKLYNKVDFGYEDQESLLANEYEAQTGQQFGGFEDDLIGISAEDELTIELPFENPQFERLLPSTNQYGFIVDKDLEQYKNAPFLLYLPNLQLTTSNLVGFSGDTYQSIQNINTPSHAINLIDGFAAQFNAEFNEYNGDLLTDNLYSRFYNDYLTDIFSPQRRQYTINANLPINIATDLRLNDRLIIKGDRFIIDNIDSDLTTGISKLVLLNDLFTSLNVGDISKLAQTSGSFTDSGSVYYTGAAFAEVITDSAFITLASSNISSGENISFTLSANETGAARAGTISVIDNLSYPKITVLQNKTGFITFANKTIFWGSTTVTFND